MPTLRAKITVRADGRLLKGFPIVRTVTHTAGGRFQEIADESAKQLDTHAGVLGTDIRTILLHPLNSRLMISWGGTHGSDGILLDKGGLFLAFDVNYAATFQVSNEDESSTTDLVQFEGYLGGPTITSV